MIKINSAMKQDEIIDLLNSHDNEVSFTFIKKEGIGLIFETNTDDLEMAAKLAKRLIREKKWSNILYIETL